MSLNELARITKIQYPPADQLWLRLLNMPGFRNTRMRLSQALEHLSPCSYLVRVQEPTEARLGGYTIKKFRPPDVVAKSRATNPSSPKYYKRAGRGKECRFTTVSPDTYVRHELSLAYTFLLEGSRVEFHLGETSKAKHHKVDWALSNRFDLRPDTILAAMPKGTTMLALPAKEVSSPEGTGPKSKRKRGEIFWALENAAALDRVGVFTPSTVKELGIWSSELKVPAQGETIHFRGLLHSQRSSRDREVLDPPEEGEPDTVRHRFMDSPLQNRPKEHIPGLRRRKNPYREQAKNSKFRSFTAAEKKSE